MLRTTLYRVVQIAAALAALLFLVPTSVGGAASYVQVTGNSMYPTLRQGDVVLLTRDDRYQVGDIIAYKSELLGGEVVIHRITAVRPNGRYATQGDHNDFIDQYEPSVQDILGKQAVRLPGAATVTQRLTGVTGMVVLIFGVGAIMMIRPRSPHGRHRRRAMRGRIS
ncbi:MAG: signal peptidase I [Ilumatobacteraceae bacterium]|nr:signal peptidase I [Ilumatobacter sp.]MCO5331772.1 signal peptidase I [Ilumatobacteraceae bacterium]